MNRQHKTSVGIIGAGPAGLLLAQMLHNLGIDAVMLEVKDEKYVRARVRAGVMEQGTVDTLVEQGVAENLRQKCLIHKGIGINFNGEQHYINVEELTGGRCVTVYGQRELTCDMIDIRQQAGLPLLFEAEVFKFSDLNNQPVVHYKHEGAEHELHCEFIAACDGFHGVGRSFIPNAEQRMFKHEYPYSWLGILANAEPASEEVVYSYHPDGFALLSMRSKKVSRLYIQCKNNENADDWSTTQLWDELDKRMGIQNNRGEIVQKNVSPLRSFVCEKMQHQRLFLAGDAAHIVPPTGAKGMNLAVADVRVLAIGLAKFYKNKDEQLLKDYSSICLRRVWKVARFSWWMTTTLHPHPNQNLFDTKIQMATLDYLTSSSVGGHSFAENYAGLPYTV